MPGVDFSYLIQMFMLTERWTLMRAQAMAMDIHQAPVQAQAMAMDIHQVPVQAQAMAMAIGTPRCICIANTIFVASLE